MVILFRGHYTAAVKNVNPFLIENPPHLCYDNFTTHPVFQEANYGF